MKRKGSSIPLPDDGMEVAGYTAHLEAKERFMRLARRQLKRTAYHEAGHAVARLARRLDFEWVAIQPQHDGDLLELFHDDYEFNFGMVMTYPRWHNPRDVFPRWIDHLIDTYAGPVAEACYVGARRVRIIGGDKTSELKLLVLSELDNLDQTARDVMTLARLLVDEHWPQIEAVAAALIETRYLTVREVRSIVKANGGV